MKKVTRQILFIFAIFILFNSNYVYATNYDSTLTNKLKGKLLLAVEDKGRIWYVNPDDSKRYEITFANALPLFQKLSLGISNKDLGHIALHKYSSAMGNRLKGKLLLQVEDKGRIWYIDTINGFKHEVTWSNLMDLFRNLSLGITNENLAKIEIETTENDSTQYINEKYGFTLSFPERWNNYTTKERIINRGISEKYDSIDFELKGYEMFNISMLEKNQWISISKMDGPKPTFISENNNYVFAHSNAQDYPENLINSAQEIPNIIKTFKLLDKANNWKKYINSRYNYEFQYPSNWYADTKYSENSFTARSPVENKDFIGGDTTWSNYENIDQYNLGTTPSDLQAVSLLIYEIDLETTLDDFIKTKHFSYNTINNININGIDGLTISGGPESQGSKNVLLKIKDKVFNFNSKSEMMDQMLQTFKVK